MLCAGIWLGGHPAKLPRFLRDLLVDSSGGLTVEATELIQDNYYRPVGETELGNASLQGMVRGLREAFRRSFLRLLLAAEPGEVQRRARRPLLRDRLGGRPR